MKKVVALLAAIVLTVSLCACNKEKKESKTKGKSKSEPTEEVSDTEDTSTTEPDPDAEGIEVVKQDLENLGFTVTDGTDGVDTESYKDAKNAFCAKKGEEFYFYGEFETEEKIKEIDNEAFPDPYCGRIRVNFGKVIWHSDSKTQGAFQYLVINPLNYKILYYKGPEDKGSRCNAYAFEMGIIPENNITMPFADDPDYPDGKGVSRVAKKVPQIDMKNDEAKALLADMYKEGSIVEEIPTHAMQVEGQTKDSRGFMILGGGGKYKDVVLLIYMESNTTDPDKTFEELKAAPEAIDLTFEERGSLRVAIGDGEQEGRGVIFDYDTGYIFRIIAETKETCYKLAKSCGFEV